MKEVRGKKDTPGYCYIEKTTEEIKLEITNDTLIGKQILIGILGSIGIICATILLYKVLCSGGVC